MDDLLDQLMKALDFRDPDIKRKLREGLEEGFSELDLGNTDVHFEFDIDGDGVHFGGSHSEKRNQPGVTVLDGGLDDEDDDDFDDDTDDEGPDLEVLEGDLDDHTDEEPDVSVRVLRAPLRPMRRRAGVGRILVDGQQTLFRGETARAYRIECDQGELRVVLDGAAVETVEAGQSIDVEAALIQVRGTAEGSYTRL